MTPPAPTVAPPPPQQDPEAPRERQAVDPAPMRDFTSHLAEQQGPNVVLVMGIVLFILACVSFFAGHLTVALALALAGVVTVVMASGLARLQIFKVEVLKLFGVFAKFRNDS